MNPEDRAPSILGVIERSDFLLLVKRTETEAVDAVKARDDMLLWAKRLLPFLDRDPHMTVAEALQLYLRALQSESPPRTTF